MRTTLILIATAAAVVLSGLFVAAPAQATKGDIRSNVCTIREYRAIKNNMTYAQVKRILDGKGRVNVRVIDHRRSFMNRNFGRSGRASCYVSFDRPGKTGKWRVYAKSRFDPNNGRYLNRYWG